jgi:hypothetical protein
MNGGFPAARNTSTSQETPRRPNDLFQIDQGQEDGVGGVCSVGLTNLMIEREFRFLIMRIGDRLLDSGEPRGPQKDAGGNLCGSDDELSKGVGSLVRTIHQLRVDGEF